MRVACQNQAQLPSDRQAETIGDMQPGDAAWTVPWAMYADEHNRLWLNGSYSISASPGGTVQMIVFRSAKDGLWRIDACRCADHKWSRGTPSYVGRFHSIPVADARF